MLRSTPVDATTTKNASVRRNNSDGTTTGGTRLELDDGGRRTVRVETALHELRLSRQPCIYDLHLALEHQAGCMCEW